MNSRCQTLKRKDRIRQPSRRIAKYTGKNIVKGYRKHFKVDPLCAAYELQMLGIEISESQVQQLKGEAENRRKQNEQRRQLKEQQNRRHRFCAGTILRRRLTTPQVAIKILVA
jgi:hypothetical protein